MYAALALEWIGHDDPVFRDVRRPHVAEVTDMREDGRVAGRRYLQGRIGFANANSVGSRGVYAHYLIPPGPVYEVKHFTSWRNEEHYLCVVTDGKVERITSAEAWRYGLEQQTAPRD